MSQELPPKEKARLQKLAERRAQRSRIYCKLFDLRSNEELWEGEKGCIVLKKGLIIQYGDLAIINARGKKNKEE